MMKKLKWKQLFSRKRSKSRDKNKVNANVCNLCAGLPLTDFNTLCDRHREQAAGKSNAPSSGILKVTKTSTISKGTKEEESPTTAKATVGTSDHTIPQTEEGEAEHVEDPDVKHDEKSGAAEILESAQETPAVSQQEPIVQGKSEKVETNEDFMAEEVDSNQLSEHSGTENTVPIVVDPIEQKNENANKEACPEDSSIKSRISFTSLLPTKTFEIPSKGEMSASMAAAEDQENQLKKSEVLYVLKKQKKRAMNREEFMRWKERNEAVKIANETWFGRDAQEVWIEDEEDDETIHVVRDETEEDRVEGVEDEEKEDTQEQEEHVSSLQEENVSSLKDGKIIQEDAPKTVNSNIEDSMQGSDNSASSKEHGGTTKLIDNTINGFEENDNAGRDEGEAFDDYRSHSPEDSNFGLAPPLPQNVSPSPDIMLPLSPEEESETGRIGGMVFGTISVDVSNQPLVFSPNFGAQGMDSVEQGGVGNTEEDTQYPYIRIYQEMRNFLAPKDNSEGTVTEGTVTEVTESAVGKIIEISSTDDGPNSEEQPESTDQAPPSLDGEEEIFETNSRINQKRTKN